MIVNGRERKLGIEEEYSLYIDYFGLGVDEAAPVGKFYGQYLMQDQCNWGTSIRVRKHSNWEACCIVKRNILGAAIELFEGACKRAYLSKKFKWRELEISYVPIPIVGRKSNIGLYYIPRMIQFSRSEMSQILITSKVEDKTSIPSLPKKVPYIVIYIFSPHCREGDSQRVHRGLWWYPPRGLQTPDREVTHLLYCILIRYRETDTSCNIVLAAHDSF